MRLTKKQKNARQTAKEIIQMLDKQLVEPEAELVSRAKSEHISSSKKKLAVVGRSNTNEFKKHPGEKKLSEAVKRARSTEKLEDHELQAMFEIPTKAQNTSKDKESP